METIYRLPFLRICLFLITGILFGITCPDVHLPVWLPLPAILPLIGTFFIPHKLQYKLRWVAGASLFILLFTVGAIRTQETTPVYWEANEEETSYVIGEVEGTPQRKRATYGVTLRLFGEGIPPKSKAMAYIAQDSASGTLAEGDILLFPTHLVIGKEEASEYEAYLRRSGYSMSFYIPKGKWRKAGNAERFSLSKKAREARQWAEERYLSNGLQGEELAIACALTLGDKSQLDRELRSSYSATGASHVLAVSGLHVGIIYLVIVSLLNIPFRGNKLKWLRITLAITALWAYAFVAGLSASVVRASVMFSLVSVGELLGRRSLTINTVFASAFIMLLYEPRYLTDVGFQLSYTAVLAILLFQGSVYKSIQVRPFLLDKAWSLTSVSIAAQLGTMPVMLYHFHQFSNCFWLSGLIVIPAATLLIYGCALSLLTTPLPAVSEAIGGLMSRLIGGMNASIRWLEGLPHSNVTNIGFDGMDVLLLYALLASLLAVMQDRSFHRICVMLSLLLTYTCYSTLTKAMI
ncbi:MAG: ComEC/Rec2 family competence protein [Paludibacteraceae bacterium]|nr:ComEC/Rec2 family competence protein [Paludibacteraceae bacterium]